MVNKFGKYPANARVDVDYRGKKPKIKFSYPRNGDSPKKQAYKQHNVGLHTLILLFPFYVVFTLLTAFPILPPLEYPESCTFTPETHYINYSTYLDVDGINITKNKYHKWIEKVNIICDNGFYQIKFNKDNYLLYQPSFVSPTQERFGIGGNLLVLLSICWLFGLGFYLSNKGVTKLLLKSKWYQKWFPKNQAERTFFFKRKKKKYKKFKPKDVENNMVEIPYFKNIELDYNTTGDFDKYLERIKIHEHSYNNYDAKKKKPGKKQVKIFKWYARFYFKQKPNTGHMEVIFE